MAVFIENRPELLVTLLALAKVGAISALLNTSLTRDTLTHSLNLVTPTAIVVGAELVPAYLAVRERVSIEMERTWFVADHFPDPVLAVVGTRRLIDQIAA